MGSGLVLWLTVVVLSGSRTTEQPAVFSKGLLSLAACPLSVQSELLVPSLLDLGGSSWQCLLSDSRCSSGLSYPSPSPCSIHMKVCGTRGGQNQKKLESLFAKVVILFK